MAKEKNTVENTLLVEEVEVTIGKEKFKITPLVRAEYKKLLGMFSEILLTIDMELIENLEDNTGVLINILSESALIELYKAHTGKEEEFFNKNMTINQEMELFNAVCEVNDLPQMIRNFTKTIRVMGAIKSKITKAK